MRTHIALALALALLAPASVMAGSNSGFLTSTVTIEKECEINSAALNFGQVSGVVSTAKTATGTISLTCTPFTTFTITANSGLNAAQAKNTTRALASGGGTYVDYELYTTSSRTLVWNQTNAISGGSSSTSGTNWSVSVHATIPGGQVAEGGLITDTVSFTVNY